MMSSARVGQGSIWTDPDPVPSACPFEAEHMLRETIRPKGEQQRRRLSFRCDGVGTGRYAMKDVVPEQVPYISDAAKRFLQAVAAVQCGQPRYLAQRAQDRPFQLGAWSHSPLVCDQLLYRNFQPVNARL